MAGLVQGSDGNFYGTTSGSGSGPSAYGTVFQITPCGSLTTLWSFTNGVDGASSYGALVQGIDGSFYGTTVGSGSGTEPQWHGVPTLCTAQSSSQSDLRDQIDGVPMSLSPSPRWQARLISCSSVVR